MATTNDSSSTTDFRYIKPKREAAISEIRRLIIEGVNHGEIQRRLGLKERTYWRYVSICFAHEREALSKSVTVEELQTTKAVVESRYTDLYRITRSIAENETHKALDRLEAVKVACEIASALGLLHIDGPSSVVTRRIKGGIEGTIEGEGVKEPRKLYEKVEDDDGCGCSR